MAVTLLALIPTLMLARIERRAKATATEIPVAISRRGAPAGGSMSQRHRHSSSASRRPGRRRAPHRAEPPARRRSPAARPRPQPSGRADLRADPDDRGARPRARDDRRPARQERRDDAGDDHLDPRSARGANIVERRRSTEDRRVCNVALTPEGWELLERKLSVWNGLWADRLSGFSDKDIETAAAILHEVTGILDTVASSLDSAEPQT